MQPQPTFNAPLSNPTIPASQPQSQINSLGPGPFGEFAPVPTYHPDTMSHYTAEVTSMHSDAEKGLGSFISSSVV
jgi:hypothetical protein